MNTYEVLLQRDIGINKTVYVHDCYYEEEAELLAESQYGLPVLRVLYKGSSNSNSYDEVNVPEPRGSWLSIGSGFEGVQLAFGILFLILLVEFWYIFLGVGIIYAAWNIYMSINS